MSHHHHDHNHHQGTKNIVVAFVLNFVFTIIEIIGGLYTNSIAILSDALHDLGDTLSLGLAWYFQKFSTKSRDKKFSYGYRRFSLLGAIINSIVLIVGSIFILTAAIPRILNPETANTEGMIIMAILGIVFNGMAVLRLKKGESINEKVVSLHLLEDVLGWVAVLVGAIIMHYTNAPILDPILSILIAAYILYNVFKNLKSTFQIIFQGIPINADIKGIQHYLNNHSKIESFHDFHIWSMDGSYNILTVHLVIHEDSIDDINMLKKNIKKELNQLGAHHVTIEFESEEERCELINC